MLSVVSWRIYYADDSTFDSTQGGPDVAPALGVIAIPYVDGPTRRVLSGFSYYAWHGEGWYGHDLFGLFQYLLTPGWKRVLFGETVPTKIWESVMHRATHDPDFKV